MECKCTSGFWLNSDGKTCVNETIRDFPFRSAEEAGKNGGLSMTGISVIAAVCVLVVVISVAVGLLVHFIRQRKDKQIILSRNELTDFFQGHESGKGGLSSNYQALPYDKLTWEISKDYFLVGNCHFTNFISSSSL